MGDGEGAGLGESTREGFCSDSSGDVSEEGGKGVGGGGISSRGNVGGGDTEEGAGRTGGLFSVLWGLPSMPEGVWAGFMGLMMWWACLSWGITYAIGVVFWRLFPEDEGVDARAPRDRTTKGKRDKDSRGKGKGKGKGGSGTGKAGSGSANGSASGEKGQP